jgi:hypothetical protein
MPKTLQEVAFDRVKDSIKALLMLFQQPDPKRIAESAPHSVATVDSRWEQLVGKDFSGPLRTNVNLREAYKSWQQFKAVYNNGRGDRAACARELAVCWTDIESARV